jgi:two-component system response regulator MprA
VQLTSEFGQSDREQRCPRLLVVEDDPKLSRALDRGLRRESYVVDLARTGEEALERASPGEHDAIVLDLMLPGIDGFAVCRSLRARNVGAPVLMLTARADVSDRIQGLDAGADDYLVKPFDFDELLARLRALLRRSLPGVSAVVLVGRLRLDPASHTVTCDERRTELTAREYAVLEVLVQNVGRVVSRRELLERVWGQHDDASANVVDVYVGYLRRKLEPASGPRLIRTVRGVGFVLEPQ